MVALSQTAHPLVASEYATAQAKRLKHLRHKLRFDLFLKAMVAGDKELVETLLPLIDPKTPDQVGKTLFMFACESGDLHAARLLYPLSDLNACTPQGNTALMCAAIYGHLHVVVELLDHMHADATLKNSHGFTAMTIACRSNDLRLVNALLEKSDLTSFDKEGFTDLMHVALYAGSASLVEAVMSKSDLFAKDAESGMTAEEWAIREGKPEVAGVLRSRREALELGHQLVLPQALSSRRPTL